MTQSLYQDHFGIRENPFSIIPDPHYLYMSQRHQEALAHLLYGIGESGGFVLLTGEVGTGKTTICRALIEQLPDNVNLALILNPRLTEPELMAAICDEMRIPYPLGTKSLKDFFDFMNRHLLDAHARGRNPVLMIDEAQNLSAQVLELIRLLTNLETAEKKLLQIILVGQPELNHILAQENQRQTAQRITARYHLMPLGLVETRNYINHRLHVAGLNTSVFGNGAIKAIHKAARGIPRLINSICDRALLAAYAEGRKQVTAKLARAAAAEVLGTQALTPGTSVWRMLTLALAITGVIFWVGFDPYRTGIKDTLGALLEPLLPPPAPEVAETPAAKPAPKREAAQEPPQETPQETPAKRVAAETAPAPIEATPALAETPAPAEAPIPAVTAIPAQAPAPAEAPEPVDIPAPGEETPPASLPAQDAPLDAPSADLPADLPADAPNEAPAAGAQDVSASEGTLLDVMINTSSPDRAFASLFTIWRKPYSELRGLTPCDKAQTAGLGCLQGTTDMIGLKAMNRPATVSFVMPDGEHVFGVLTKISGDVESETVAIQLEDRTLSMSAAAFVLRWPGDYLVLWQPPKTIERPLVFGQQGPDVREFRHFLAQAGFADGEKDLQGLGSVFYGPSLREQVRAFQEAHGLRVDGIAGPETLLRITGVAGQTAVPSIFTHPAAAAPGE